MQWRTAHHLHAAAAALAAASGVMLPQLDAVRQRPFWGPAHGIVSLLLLVAWPTLLVVGRRVLIADLARPTTAGRVNAVWARLLAVLAAALLGTGVALMPDAHAGPTLRIALLHWHHMASDVFASGLVGHALLSLLRHRHLD
jgi:hypothetical protein